MLRVFALATLTCAAAVAQTPLINNPLACFNMEGEPSSDLAIVNVQGMPFTQAWHIVTEHNSTNLWDIRPRCFNTLPAKKGDTVLATFWMRTISSTASQGMTTFVIEKGADPYTKSVSWTAATGSQWTQYTVPFTMLEDYDGRTGATSYNASFWVTFDPQVIEIGGFSLVDYGQNYPYSQLPLVNWPYAGHDLNAPWRAIADARIERIRKADVAVVVRDDSGKPIPNATVHVKMKKHAFGWGTAVAAEGIADTSTDGQKYRDIIASTYNKVVFENDLKWPPWESWPRQRTFDGFTWLNSVGITDIRGHNLIWPGKLNLPSDVVAMIPGQPDALRTRIDNHFTDELGTLSGKCTEWDVVNEPIANHDVQDVLGHAEMIHWYQHARALDPHAKLFVNDYNIVAAGGVDLAHQNAYYNEIKYLIDNGAPLDGFGVQSHFDLNMTPPERVWSILDRFATLGKDIEVTEFDINTTDEQLQADYTRDFMTATFAHPAIKGFLMWGFWEGRHWLPQAALYRLNWDIKPNGLVWKNLIYNKWWTDVQGTTNTDGVFVTRGFLGDYSVDVTANGQTQTYPLTFKTAGQQNYVTVGNAGPAPSTDAAHIVNAASFVQGPVAPGEIITIFGSNVAIAPGTTVAYDDTKHIPTWTAGTKVYFDGVAAPMIYAGVGQVSAVVPYGVSGTTSMQVEYLGQKSTAVSLPVASAAPGVFACGGKPTVPVLVNNSNGKISCNADWVPVKTGDILTLFITGEGQTSPGGQDGLAPTAPVFPKPVQNVSVSFGSAAGNVQFAGLVYAGVTQINVKVPDTAPSGANVPLNVSVGSAAAQNGLSLAIQ